MDYICLNEIFLGLMDSQTPNVGSIYMRAYLDGISGGELHFYDELETRKRYPHAYFLG
jgi:hypothetical protein